MKTTRSGFTLVEVALFLAITGLVFAGIVVGTQNSIFQQRYNDSVQNFAEFLRRAYSQVENVQSNGSGNGSTAIYGRLIVFGEEGGKNKITSYAVIGGIAGEGYDDLENRGTLEGLIKLDAKVSDDMMEEYIPRWGAEIQTKDGFSGGYGVFTGAVLIVRHPETGEIYTFEKTGDVAYGVGSEIVGEFEQKAVDFCVNPNGAEKSSLRKDVRIVDGAKNTSGVEVVSGEGECAE